MEVLNIVFSALNLLATVIIGVIQLTWTISRMSLGTSRAQSIILTTKQLLPQRTNSERSFTFLIDCQRG